MQLLGQIMQEKFQLGKICARADSKVKHLTNARAPRCVKGRLRVDGARLATHNLNIADLTFS